MPNYEDLATEALREILRRLFLGYSADHDENNPQHYDPSKPAHPIFNPPPRPEQTFGEYLRQRKEEELVRFQPFDEIVARIKAREFNTKTALGRTYGKDWKWLAGLKQMVLKYGGMSEQELRACFRRSRNRVSRYDPNLTARPSKARLSKELFERIMKQRDETLNFEVVLNLLRAGCWKQADTFAKHFGQHVRWATSLRRFLQREQILTSMQWRLCFK